MYFFNSWCDALPALLTYYGKGKGEKRLKVGRKRTRKEREKEREKAYKLDCQDSSSRFSANCQVRLHETPPRSQGNKTQDTFDLRMSGSITRPTILKETLHTRLQM